MAYLVDIPRHCRIDAGNCMSWELVYDVQDVAGLTSYSRPNILQSKKFAVSILNL